MACTITNHTMYSVFGLKNINAQIWMLIKEAEDYEFPFNKCDTLRLKPLTLIPFNKRCHT